MTVYLDNNATTPTDPRVADVMYRHLVEDYGNAGSRTHAIGSQAKRAVQQAREQVAAVVDVRADDVVFTSGATESNNLAILGLEALGVSQGRQHVIASAVEHKAVLEPLERLAHRGFDVDLLPPGDRGWPDADELAARLRPDTVLVSTMHANNETGVLLPLDDYAEVLCDHDAYWHVDAAQGFGKEFDLLRHGRIDLISVSAHKVFGPKGVGALIMRRRGFTRPKLAAVMVGGGQERGLRPGTLPVHQIVGFGLAAELAAAERQQRRRKCVEYRETVLEALSPLEPVINGDPGRALPHVLNVSFPGSDAEALMVTLKDLVAVSNGSACTSESYEPSHVLKAMGLSDDRITSALRFSWSHLSEHPDWDTIRDRIRSLL